MMVACPDNKSRREGEKERRMDGESEFWEEGRNLGI